MEERAVSSDAIPRPVGPYSQGIVAGGLLFTAGQVALERKSGKPLGGSVYEQTRTILRNISEILRSAGATPGDILKTTVYLKDMASFQEMNQAYSECFAGTQAALPARTTVGASLPLGVDVEIEAVSLVPNAKDAEPLSG